MRELHGDVDIVFCENVRDYFSQLMLPLRAGAHIKDSGDSTWEPISFRAWDRGYQVGLAISLMQSREMPIDGTGSTG
jgi:hypothetical protein